MLQHLRLVSINLNLNKMVQQNWPKKIELSLCLTNKHYAMKAYGEENVQI
jgi:hypothetical protein